MSMALVSKIHAATEDNTGDIITDLMIWREGEEIPCHLQLRHIHGEAYQVVSGGNEAVRIFGLRERVWLKRIANQRFTHLITQ